MCRSISTRRRCRRASCRRCERMRRNNVICWKEEGEEIESDCCLRVNKCFVCGGVFIQCVRVYCVVESESFKGEIVSTSGSFFTLLIHCTIQVNWPARSLLAESAAAIALSLFTSLSLLALCSSRSHTQHHTHRSHSSHSILLTISFARVTSPAPLSSAY